MALPPPVLMSPSKPGSRGVTTNTLYRFPSLRHRGTERPSYNQRGHVQTLCMSCCQRLAVRVICVCVWISHSEHIKTTCVCRVNTQGSSKVELNQSPDKGHVLPIRSDDALSDSVSYPVENVFVICTADEELILKHKTPNRSQHEHQARVCLVPFPK